MCQTWDFNDIFIRTLQKLEEVTIYNIWKTLIY